MVFLSNYERSSFSCFFPFSDFITDCIWIENKKGETGDRCNQNCKAILSVRTEGKNQTLVGAIPFCGEYPCPRFEDKFRSANQIDGISIADGGKMADS